MSDIFILNDDKKQNDQTNSSDFREEGSFMDRLNEKFLASQSIKVKEKVVLYRLLATMVNAGLSLVKTISILEKQEKNPVVKRTLAKSLIELKAGKNLSEAFSMFPQSFSDAELGILESGEKTGRLNDALLTLADQVEKVASISGKIKSALMYPAMIMLVVGGVLFVMMTMIVPKLLEIFDDPEKLPASTKILKAVSDVFVNHWWIILLVLGSLVMGISIWKKTPKGKYNFDKIMLKVPVFGMLLTKVALSKFARVVSGLLSSGVSIVESLRIASETVGNEVYKQRIMLLREDVKKGLKIWEGLDGDKLFPIMFVQMIQVGEQTAQIDKVIVKVADFYDEEVDNVVSTINKLLEPMIIVFLAVVVGGIAVGIMQPIMQLADQVSNT